MKRFLLSAICIAAFTAPLIGDEKLKPSRTSQAPFDEDLYRQNEQVFSLHGDFLFWRVQEGALDYALTMQESAWGPAECFAQGKFENATFNGDPGFRVTGSFYRAPKYWEIWAQYTRLTARGENSSGKPTPGNEFVTGTWPQIFTSPVAKAESHIHMNYNVADLWADRVFYPNPHLRLRLLGGGSVAWIDQFWKVEYSDSGGNETSIGNRWKFIGGGLRMGTLFDWYWFMSVYMTGGVTFASLLGSYSNTSVQTTNFSPAAGAFNPSIPLRNAHFSDVRPAFNGQFFLGPSVQRSFLGSRMELFIGYELVAWLNLQETFHSTSGAPSDAKETWINTGMIALQGLTSRFTMDF